jgi:signal transduction histidine kinase
MGFTGLIVIVFVILIVANLVARASRNRGAGSFEDEYYKPTRGREAPTSARRWKAKNDSWGDNIVRMDEALERIKSQVDEPPPAPSNPQTSNTQLLLSEKKLKRYVNELREQEATLKLAKQKAEEASSKKGRFLSTMTHEIRTPLHAVTGIVQLLIRENTKPEKNVSLEFEFAPPDDPAALVLNSNRSRLGPDHMQCKFVPIEAVRFRQSGP